MTITLTAASETLPSSASMASRLALARMWEYRRSIAELTCPIISSIVLSVLARIGEFGAERMA